MKAINELYEEIKNAERIHIYGAGLMGKALLKCLSERPFNKKIDSFIVKSLANNPPSVEGVPVFDLLSALLFKDELVLVALHEKYIQEAIEDIKNVGFKKVIPVTFDCDLWAKIRLDWMIENGLPEWRGIELLDDCIKESNIISSQNNKELKLYVVHSTADKELKEKVGYKKFEVPIQVGASLADNKIYEICDDQGENISDKNRQYCELTGLYWIWKNDSSDYVGLCHYRRRFCIKEEQAEHILNSDIDVIVTAPLVNFTSVRRQYVTDHDENDWDIMIDAIKELYPEYYLDANKVQNGQFYYAYNMFIAKKKIFDEYCQWLFSILNYCEKRISPKADVYQNRYAGFLAERLLTIYLVHNKQYRIVIADKHFIESV